MRRYGALLNLVVFSALAAGVRAENACLQPGSGAVTITGTLVQKLVPGPPNHQSVKHGDAARVRWMIRLEASVCVASDAADNTETSDVAGVRVIELVIPLQTIKKRSLLVGKRVTATGFISTKQMEHQQAVVLLDVRAIDEAP